MELHSTLQGYALQLKNTARLSGCRCRSEHHENAL